MKFSIIILFIVISFIGKSQEKFSYINHSISMESFQEKENIDSLKLYYCEPNDTVFNEIIDFSFNFDSLKFQFKSKTASFYYYRGDLNNFIEATSYDDLTAVYLEYYFKLKEKNTQYNKDGTIKLITLLSYGNPTPKLDTISNLIPPIGDTSDFSKKYEFTYTEELPTKINFYHKNKLVKTFYFEYFLSTGNVLKHQKLMSSEIKTKKCKFKKLFNRKDSKD